MKILSNWEMKKQTMLQEMKGQTFVSVEKVGEYRDELVFTNAEGVRYVFYHGQDCCETVYIEDITGDLSDLVGAPLIVVSEETSDTNPVGVEVPKYQECFQWTFYKFATIKGYVDVRWYGDSNGYYSVDVDMRKEIPDSGTKHH